MPRDLPIANGRALVNFDDKGSLWDSYWPHVGLQNQTMGHVNHTCVWVDGQFSWFDSDDWKRQVNYVAETLVTDVMPVSGHLQHSIACADTVDFDRDIVLRRLRAGAPLSVSPLTWSHAEYVATVRWRTRKYEALQHA